MIIALFKTFRVLNLFMMALCMFLIRYFLILPAFRTEAIITGEYPVHSDKWHFLLLVIASLLIAAAGYLINDIYDVHTDEINKPGKNQIGRKITEGMARGIYYLLNAIGIILGMYLAIHAGKPIMGVVFIFSAASLWMYATQYKRLPLSGNVLIAVLSGLVPVIPALYEPSFYPNIFYTLVFGIFSFLLSLCREIVKDIEDVDGDERSQFKTFPVRYGITATRSVLYIILTGSGLFTAYILHLLFYTNNVINFWYLVAIFEIPVAAIAYLVSTAKEKKDYSFTSNFIKLTLLAGILSVIPFYYYFLR
ncbi:MAG: geranylgeranylglycerol-phosphate geranylgeranyltransferase [Bacteroidia bacterium]|nr:geranylgeranylglycerol-phosphate geranylgeranyltransferase [Bacteroidia bacterium]